MREATERLAAADGAVTTSVVTTVAGAALHHLESGRGRPMVLLHGGSGGGANWFRIIPRLSTHARVLAPDLPGFGLSDPGRPRSPLGTTAADTLAQWMAALGLTDAVIAGTSFGGLAALRLAQQASERVASVFLLDSAGLGRELHPLVRLATVPGLTRLGVRPTRAGTATVFRNLLTANRASLTDEQSDALVDYLYLSARRAGTPYLAETLRLFCGPMGQREVLSPAELAALAQPVHVAWGALDRFLPVAHGQSAARHCHRSRFTLLDDAGHSPNWETPDAVSQALLALLAAD